MKNEINKKCTELNDGKIAVSQATEQLFDLFNVSKRSELLKFLAWYDERNDFKHYPNINEGIIDEYIKL